MNEYFVLGNSFAAPFFSDTDEQFVVAEDHLNALNDYVKNYKHPCGLYAAAIYPNADAYHKGQSPLARWLSNKAQAREQNKDVERGVNEKEGRIVT